VLCGGDGSYMEGLSALRRAFGDSRSLPRIAFAPGGTVNTIAKNWGMRGNAIAYSRKLLDGVANGTVVSTRRPSLRVEATPRSRDTARAEKTVRLSFIFGAGLVAKFFRIYESRGAKGTAEAAKIVARVFTGSFVGSKFARSVLDPQQCELIEVDGERAPFDRVSLLCASVVKDLGLGMRLLYRAGEDVHRFHVVGTPLKAPLLGPQMPLVLLGKPLRGTKIDTLSAQLRIRFPQDEGAYVIDGDLFQDADEVVVTAGPVLDVLTPATAADSESDESS
jgi:diacylglycerol kinase (ATP)